MRGQHLSLRWRWPGLGRDNGDGDKWTDPRQTEVVESVGHGGRLRRGWVRKSVETAAKEGQARWKCVEALYSC